MKHALLDIASRLEFLSWELNSYVLSDLADEVKELARKADQ